MITELDAMAWKPLRFHPIQDSFYRSSARFRAVVAGRGSGKTEISRRKVVRWLPVRKPWSNPIYFYALPTRDQAKRVAWPYLKQLIPKSWIAKSGISESELTITTVFGSKLYLLGMDKPQRAEGVQWDGGIVDESCDQHPGMFDRTLRPALAHKVGWCDRIGVPKRSGPGAHEFKLFYERGLPGDHKDPDIESFTWPSSDILPPEEIDSARRTLDEKDYNEQFNASWETIGGAVFYGFSDALNVSDAIAYNPDLSLLVGCDFNVDPMAWVICQSSTSKQGVAQLRVIDEIFLRNTNTEECLKYFKKKYESHKSGVTFFGDATGKARKTAASESDYIQIRNFTGLEASRVMFPDSNPARHDRFASCNAMFYNAARERRTLVHPRCRNLIRDLVSRAYKPGTSEPDDHDDISHASDALGYLIHWLYPLQIKSTGKIPSVPSM